MRLFVTRLLRGIAQAAIVFAGILLLSWGLFALWAYPVLANGGPFWTNPAIRGFLAVELPVLAVAATAGVLSHVLGRAPAEAE